jgi:hypothetical protein
MATVVNSNTAAQLSGLLKRVYPEETLSVIPEANKLTQELGSFSQTHRVGEKFQQAVEVAMEQGVGYFAPGASNAPALPDSTGSTVVQASVDSYEIALNATINTDIIARSLGAPNARAFKQAFGVVLESALRSHRKRLEVQALYGGTNIGVADTGSTGTTLIITKASFAPYIWNSARGTPIDIYSAGGVYKGTTSVLNTSNNTKTVTLSAAVGNGGLAATDVIYYAGAKGNEAIGINQIITTSGSLFGIDNTVYDQWAGSTFDAANGVLSKAVVDQAVNAAVEKGLSAEELTLFVNTRSWNDLMHETDVRARYNDAKDASEREAGTKGLKYWTMSGEIKVVPHTLVKEGEAYVLNMDTFKRVGAVDLKLGGPMPDDQEVVKMQNNLGYQMMTYSHQSLFCEAPYKNVLIKNILPTAA